MAADRTVVYRITADVRQAQAQMAALGASVRQSADSMTSATAEGERFRGGLTSLGNTAGKVGLVAAVGLGAAVMKAAEFDAAMSNVQAATHESAASMELLRQAALDAGAQTAFSATEAAAGIENLAKAGISTADILDGALAGALDLAAAGEMSVADAAEAAAGALAQFKLEGDQATHVADLLAAGAGKAQGDVSDMVFALKQAGTVAAQTGLSLEETTGALSAMAEQSLLGSDAGTSFKTMLAALTPNSKKAAEAMEQYNIHAFDAQGNFVGMTALAGQLEAGLGDLTVEQRAMALETIFGSDAVRAASIIYDNGAEGIANWTDKVNDAGYAAETAAIKQDNLRGDIEKLGGALETAFIGTGNSSQGGLRSLTQSLEDTVNAYNKLGDGAKSGIAVTLGATVALGGGLFIFSKMVMGIAATRVALTQLGVSATTTSKLMAGVGKAGFGLAGLAAAGMAIDAVRKSLEETLPGMSTLTGQIIAISEGKVASLGSEFDSLAGSIDRLADPGYIYESSDAILGLLTLGQVDGAEVDGARQEVEALDAALANLASSGGSAAAKNAFEKLAEAQELSADEQKTLLTLLPGYTEALASNANQATLTGKATAGFGYETAAAGDAMAEAESATENFKDTLEQLNAELGGRAGVRDYQAAIDELSGSLKENGRTFDVNTAKGRANQAALDNIAGTALKVAESMGEADRQKFLTTAIKDLRTMGANMGLPKSEVNALIALLQAANKTDVKPKVVVDASSALSSFRQVDQYMSNLDGRVATTFVRTVNQGGMGPQKQATGGYISGPGTATSDSIPALLSNGEYVIKAAAVDHYGAGTFDRMNAMRLAGGGKVGGKKKPKRGLERDEDSDSVEQSGPFAQQVLAMTQGMIQAARMQEEAADVALSAGEDQLKASQDSLSAAETLLDGTKQLRDSFADSVSGQFSGSLTGGGLEGLMRTLGNDINAGSSMTSTLEGLTSAGLDPTSGLFKELAASNDLATTNELLAGGPGAIDAAEAAYAERQRVNTGRGEFAADASFAELITQQGQAVVVAQAQFDQSEAHVQRLEAQLGQATAWLTALHEGQSVLADQFAGAMNGVASSAGRSAPKGQAQAGRWR